jgi:hypothetical protein
MSVGYSRFSTLGEDERYHFDAASRRVLDGHAQVSFRCGRRQRI